MEFVIYAFIAASFAAVEHWHDFFHLTSHFALKHFTLTLLHNAIIEDLYACLRWKLGVQLSFYVLNDKDNFIHTKWNVRKLVSQTPNVIEFFKSHVKLTLRAWPFIYR